MKILPHAIESEMALLGSILVKSSVLKEVHGLVTPDTFYVAKHRVIFKAISELSSKTNEIDLISLSTFLRDQGQLDQIGGASYLTELINNTPTTVNAKHHAEIVQEKSIMREIINYSDKLSTIGYDESKNIGDILSSVQSLALKISNLKSQITHTEATDIDAIISQFKVLQGEYEQKFLNGGKIIGLTTGYPKLDSTIDGLRAEHLWIVGGYTNVGKSSAVLNIVGEQVRNEKRVVMYSLEMGNIDILARLLGIMTNQSGIGILKASPHDIKPVERVMEQLTVSGMSIHTTLYEISEILFSMREEMALKPVDVFVVDFIQNVTVKDAKSEYETITTAILALQQMAKQLHVPIIVLSQVSNESVTASERQLIGFKGTGALAAAADFAIEITNGEESIKDLREKMNAGQPVKMKWNIRKNRHGPVGYVPMTFEGKTGIFTQYNESSDF